MIYRKQFDHMIYGILIDDLALLYVIYVVLNFASLNLVEESHLCKYNREFLYFNLNELPNLWKN